MASLSFEIALRGALHFSQEWGVRCAVYGRKRSGKWLYVWHPTLMAFKYGPPLTQKPLVLAVEAPESKTQDQELQSSLGSALPQTLQRGSKQSRVAAIQ